MSAEEKVVDLMQALFDSVEDAKKTHQEANAELDARISDPDACKACDQSGKCKECDGHGILPWIGSGTGDDHIACEPCGGDGDCPTCEGEGTMRPYR